MGVLLWIIGIPLAIYWFFKLFGKQIAQLAMRRMVKTLEKEAKRQSEQYRRSYTSSQGQKNIYVDEDLKVTAQPGTASKEISEDEIVEDVDFEEVKSQ